MTKLRFYSVFLPNHFLFLFRYNCHTEKFYIIEISFIDLVIALKMNFTPKMIADNSKLLHDIELERDRLRLIPASTNSSFKPGTCVRIEGFVEKQKYNGMLGQVKKSIEGDTYRVMLSSEKTEFASG